MSKASRRLRSTSLIALCLLVPALALIPSGALAKGCIETLPDQLRVPPSTLWNGSELQPLGVIWDATNYNGVPVSDSHYPQATSVAVKNGYLYASYYAGFAIYDLADPEHPAKLSMPDGWRGVFPRWAQGISEVDSFVYSLAVAPADDNLLALGAISPVGFSIWDTTNKANPTALYQDANGKEIQQVYADTIGGHSYAFAGGEGTGTEVGLFIYDMTEARNRHYSGCLEDVSGGVRNCPGVYVGKIGNSRVLYVHGMQFGSRHFIVTSTGTAPAHSVQIWDVSTPSNPVPVLSAFNGSRVDTLTRGVAMWQQNNSAYLAVRLQTKLQIYDVSNCLTNGCSSLPPAVGPGFTIPALDASPWHSVDYSTAGGTPFLFLGNSVTCHIGDGPQHSEFVLDVSHPDQPRDITPTATTNYLGETVDYWSYYYSDTVKGFSYAGPRNGKLYTAANGKNYFYRADLTLLDVHEWFGGAGLPPSASFTWSPGTDIYVGDPVQFTNSSIAPVSTWAWTFQDGSPTAGSVNPQSVTFTSPGTKAVGLTVNPGGATNSQSVLVLKPSPAIAGGVSYLPGAPVRCNQVAWTANGVTGKPPLNVSWVISDASNPPQTWSGSGNPFNWDTTTVLPGDYTGTVTVSNSGNPSATSAPVTLHLIAPPTLPGAGQFTPTKDPSSSGAQQFHLNVPGATEWCWDFGDGQSFPAGCTSTAAWSKDPAAGPNPTHSFATGTWNVKVSVRNCLQPAGVTSAVLPVVVINPLIAHFQAAQCDFGCSTGQAIAFADSSQGAPDGYYYNWNYTGSDTASCGAAATGDGTLQTAHTYATAGSFRPCLKVTRGAASDVYLHPVIIVTPGGGPPPPPSISISGASTGSIGQAVTFTASAANCVASVSGWSWSVGGGGALTSPSSTSQATISWPTAGTKTVTATNTACTGVSGSKSVTITDGGGGGGGGGGGLTASFTVNPATPNKGQAVSFDASASTGAPTSYLWTFGDGQTASGTTATTTHTYVNEGTYSVKLDTSKLDASCSFGLCAASITKTVVVGNGGPPPLVASFSTSATCSEFAGQSCAADVGTPVSFTSTTANATSYSWSFGDGGSASGAQATHTWSAPGTFSVQLTVSDGRSSASVARTFAVSGTPVTGKKSVILPWIAQTRGALVQSSDLYVLNPGRSALGVTLTFRKRGVPETNPPKVTRTLQPGATLYVADALREIFNRENVAGFITLTVDQGDVEPIITSFNTTLQTDGSEFGQTIPGLSLSSAGSPASSPGATQVQNLVGLTDNSERLAYFGLSNPGEGGVTYTLRFFDHDGKLIGAPHDLLLGRLVQRQFQVKEIRELFGVTDQDDYRVEIRSTGGLIFPYGANLRLGSEDPSFIGVGTAAASKVFLVGAMSTPGLNHSTWLSDVVISNTANEVVLTDVSFTGTGANTPGTSTVRLTLQPGETRRLSDVVGQQWSIRNAVGVITFDSDAPGGVYPVIQGESYENTNPSKRFGQSMPAMSEAQAAVTGGSQFLVGLRQDAKNRTTFWVFNPGSQTAVYDIIYLGLDGHEIGRIPNVAMNPGKSRQFSPGQHPLPAGGVQGGFTVQVQVRAGKALAAAQVINNATNDPAYIQGATR